MTIIDDLRKARDWIERAASASRDIRNDPDLTRDDVVSISGEGAMNCEEAALCINRALDNLGADN